MADTALDNGELGLTGRWASSLDIPGLGVTLEDSVIILDHPQQTGEVTGATEARAPDRKPNLTLELTRARDLLDGRWSGWVPGALHRRLVGSVVLTVAGPDRLTGSVDYVHRGAPMTAALRLTRTPLGDAPPEDPDRTPPEGIPLNT